MSSNDLQQSTQTVTEVDHSTEDFIERMGLVFQADGLPRIAGRMMAFLVLYPGPFSFAELAERLEISRGSVSTNTRLLEDLEIIERVAKPGRRQDYFQLHHSPYDRLLRASLKRFKRAQEVVVQAQQDIEGHRQEPQQRLGELADFYGRMIKSIDGVIQNYESSTGNRSL